jgi:putative ABC transport system permease protein
MNRLYRFLLRIYPVGFREEYGSELERQFADEYREAAGRGERLRLLWRALADLAATAPPEIARELRQDLAYAVRVYRQRFTASVLALVALALAIGATTGIFSVLNAVLIRSLPFHEPERLVEIDPGPRLLQELRPAYLEETAVYSPQPMNLGTGRDAYRVTVAETSANFLRMLGAEPERGRFFAAGEDAPGHSRVAVIGFGLWQQAFGGDPRAVGSTIRLNGEPLTVIGVAPRQFDFPEQASVWTPTAFEHLPSFYFLPKVVGRIRAGVTVTQAAAMDRADLLRAGLDDPLLRLQPLQNRLAGPVRAASLVLMGMMAFVLLIACANLAHLLLSRTTERRQELAIRSALGASPARLTRQLITEATVLTATASIAGLAVARWTAQLAAVAQPSQLAARPYSVLDWRVVTFALALAAITGVVFGVLPASLIGRMQPGPELIRMQPGSRGAAARRARTLLIALQAALSVALAAGAFSMGRSFLRLMGIDLGYRTSHVLTMSVSLPLINDRVAPFAQRALDRLRSVPGVESAGAASYLPLVNSPIQEGTFFRLDRSQPSQSTRVMVVTPDFFRAMGTPVLEGREFTAADKRGASPVVIVTEQFARRFSDTGLLGRRIYLEPASVWATVVGIVQSQRFLGPEADRWDVIYRPMDQYEQWFATFIARVHGSPERYLAVCREAVQGADRSVPVFDARTLEQRLDDAVARPRFYTTVIVFLSAFALLLAGVGAYGSASHAVSQRRHEIGIRIAVGGPPRRVQLMVFRQSMAPVFAGAAAGLLAAASLGPLLRHLFASAEPVGPAMWTAAVIAIVLATGGAIWAGTSRVVRTDPTFALRVE